MKRAELIIGKTYYVNKASNWQENHYSISESYAKTGESLARYKVTVIETQLKTEADKQWRTRDVLIRNSQGQEKWVALNHIRCEWIEAVKILTDDWRNRISYNDRGVRYQRHLQRKREKEEINPAIAALCEEIKRVTGEYVSRYDRVESLELKTLLTLTKALSVIKTELTAVA